MKKITIIILCFLIIPSVFAWGWNTHQMFVEKVYDSMPLELQERLNLSLMKEGAIAPDKDFHDNVLHHYPPSYNLSLKWLDFDCHNECNYTDASYRFSVAAHYISDSFVAPHNIKKENWKLHSEFEKQGKKYVSKVKCNDYNLDLKKNLEIGSENSRDWGEWMLNKDEKIVYREIDQSMMMIYSVAFDKFDFKCAKLTNIEKMKGYLTKRNIFIGLIFLVVIMLILYFLNKRFKY